jgi:hypothetical protein
MCVFHGKNSSARTRPTRVEIELAFEWWKKFPEANLRTTIFLYEVGAMTFSKLVGWVRGTV